MAVGNEKLRTELQSGTTLKAKRIDVSVMMDNCAKVHSITDNNMKNESHQEEEDDDSSKQEKADSEWQPEDKKEEDKEYDDEDLGEEDLKTLFNTTNVESKMKSSYSSLKYVFDYIYHGSCLS